MRFLADNDTLIKVVKPTDVLTSEVLIDMQLKLYICFSDTETTVVDFQVGATTSLVVATEGNLLGADPSKLFLTSIEGIYSVNVSHDVLSVSVVGDNTVYELDVDTTNQVYSGGGLAYVPVDSLSGLDYVYDASTKTYYVKVSGSADISPEDNLLLVTQAENYVYRLQRTTIAQVRVN